MINVIDGGVTAPLGFEAAGIMAGIKKDKKDMAMVYSQAPCKAAGVFTRNIVKAAPVKWDRQVVDSGVDCHAVVVNSGVANACTGEEGMAFWWLPPVLSVSSFPWISSCLVLPS